VATFDGEMVHRSVERADDCNHDRVGSINGCAGEQAQGEMMEGRSAESFAAVGPFGVVSPENHHCLEPRPHMLPAEADASGRDRR